MKVLRVHPKDTLPLRQQMLRQGKPIEACVFPGDNDEQTFHLGAFVDNKLVSVASFYFEKHPLMSGENHFRLRGMATLPEHQHKGYSHELLKMAFPIIKQNFCTVVWCNARMSALGFYEKVGFKKIGAPFELSDIGPHILMAKSLEQDTY